MLGPWPLPRRKGGLMRTRLPTPLAPRTARVPAEFPPCFIDHSLCTEVLAVQAWAPANTESASVKAFQACAGTPVSPAAFIHFVRSRASRPFHQAPLSPQAGPTGDGASRRSTACSFSCAYAAFAELTGRAFSAAPLMLWRGPPSFTSSRYGALRTCHPRKSRVFSRDRAEPLR